MADQPGQLDRRIRSYMAAPYYGAVLGYPTGLILGGKTGGRIGAAVGAAGSVGVRAALGKRIDKLEKAGEPHRAGGLSVGPQLAMGAAGVGLFLKGGSILRGTRKAGEATRGVMKKAAKFTADLNKGRTKVVDHIPVGAKTILSSRKQLMSARDQLDTILFTKKSKKSKQKLLKLTKRQPEGGVPGDSGAGTNALSARERFNLICFGDPRPRNPLGEFSGAEDQPNPNSVATVYKSAGGNSVAKDIAIGAGGGLAANGAATGIRAILAKAKKARV